jgi:hypothetical protein
MRSRITWLPKHATEPNVGAAQTLTSSYVTLGGQFQVSDEGQLSIKMRHTATAGSQVLDYIVEESDDDIEVTEGDSVWHSVGGQTNSGGALTEEGWVYSGAASSGAVTRGLVSLVVPLIAKKARIRVKSSANAGQALATIAFLPIT